MDFLVISHRGDTKRYPENTVEAIRSAASVGAGGVELDVRITADECLVLCHDASLRGLDVATSTLDDLRKVDLGDGYRVPILEEALEACGGLFTNLELKFPMPDLALFVTKLADSIADFGGRLLVSSFYQPAISAVAEKLPEVDIGVLTTSDYDADGEQAIRVASEHSYTFVLPQDPAVSKTAIDRAKSKGLRMIVWTVNDPMRMTELRDFGVDGIITDETRLAIEALVPR